MRKALVEKNHSQISIRKQSELLDVNRNRLEPPRPKVTAEDEKILRLLDEIHLNEPTFGARRMQEVIGRDHNLWAGRDRIIRLMKLAEIYPCYPRPRTSLPGKGHVKYPYLLRGLDVNRPNQVWCGDITYIPMPVGFCYLMAVMDWYSRAVLGWSVSTTMDARICLEAWEMAVRRAGCTPEIMNTDQGSQFTSAEWIEELKQHESLQISMDGKGRWVDNVFIERLWWSLKYEDVYLKAYETPWAVEKGVSGWFDRYNTYRPHSSLGKKTPWSVHFSKKEEEVA